MKRNLLLPLVAPALAVATVCMAQAATPSAPHERLPAQPKANNRQVTDANARSAAAKDSRKTNGPADVTFTDVTAQSGIVQNNASWGAAWADYDNDGHVDVFTVGHLQHPNPSICQLWHSNGDGTFTDVTEAAGMIHSDGDAHAAAWADVNGDGDLDLYVAKGTDKSLPANYNDLWINNGDGTFTNVASSSGVIGLNCHNRGANFIDYDNDSRLDILATSFFRPGGGGNLLYHNDGRLQFTDMAATAGIARDGVENRTAAWADFDRDGRVDVFFTKIGGLFRNNGDGTFGDVTAAAGLTNSADAQASAWGDYDNDTRADLYITFGTETDGVLQSILYHNNGDGTFTDVTAQSGTANNGSALGTMWGDYDNDGFLDLYVVNSISGFSFPNRLYHNNGDGTFTDVAVAAGVGAKVAGGRGSDATFVDYDDDGFLDLFVCNGAGSSYGPYELFRNDGNGNHWLKVNLVGKASNGSAIGAKVLVRAGGTTRMREYTEDHYMSQNHLPVHFGLGAASTVSSLKIQWPSGTRQQLRNVATNQTITVVEQ